MEEEHSHKRRRTDGEIEQVAPEDGIAVTEQEEEKKTDSKAVKEPKVPSYTLSIAIPGSIIENAQSKQLQTYVAGQIARAASIFEVDEVVVFEDRLNPNREKKAWDPNIFLAHILQYLETPQYLRKALVPHHPDLQFAGLLNPLDAPHHLRASEPSKYREGVVLKRPTKGGQSSFVDIGLRKEATVNSRVAPGTRITVELEDPTWHDKASGTSVTESGATYKNIRGRAVAPSVPRQDDGRYWGYDVRIAPSFASVLTDSPYPGGYDLTVGTSDKGTASVGDEAFYLPKAKHILVVFGGLSGLEEIVENDNELDILARDTPKVFDFYVNTCPKQGSRTIRTEEAVLISLAALRPYIDNPGPEAAKTRVAPWKAALAAKAKSADGEGGVRRQAWVKEAGGGGEGH